MTSHAAWPPIQMGESPIQERFGQTLVHLPSAAPDRIGVMGGTFDPIHHGHLVAASEVADRFNLDLVIFVPTGQPWQKSERQVSPAEDRYLMTVIATASNPRFTVSRVDIDREGPTYTYDTLQDLRRQFPQSELFFITGADAITSIMSWRKWEEMLNLARFVGVTRPGYELSHDLLPAEHRDSIAVVEIPAMAISSTDCRDRASKGRPVWYLVPDGVVQYIQKRKLYAPEGSDDSRDPAPMTSPPEPDPNAGRHSASSSVL